MKLSTLSTPAWSSWPASPSCFPRRSPRPGHGDGGRPALRLPDEPPGHRRPRSRASAGGSSPTAGASPSRRTRSRSRRPTGTADERGASSGTTGKVESGQSQHVVYEGPALGSGERAWWRVRVWDEADERSKWSDWAFWEMGLLAPGDWTARWIEPDLRGGLHHLQPGADAAPGVRGEEEGGLGAGLRHRPRPLRGRDQRAARGRPALHPRLDRLRRASPVPDLRRRPRSCRRGRTPSA